MCFICIYFVTGHRSQIDTHHYMHPKILRHVTWYRARLNTIFDTSFRSLHRFRYLCHFISSCYIRSCAPDIPNLNKLLDRQHTSIVRTTMFEVSNFSLQIAFFFFELSQVETY